MQPNSLVFHVRHVRIKVASEPPLYAFGLHGQLQHNRLRHAISPNYGNVRTIGSLDASLHFKLWIPNTSLSSLIRRGLLSSWTVYHVSASIRVQKDSIRLTKCP
ncbi:hypothetical protein CY34DRAFT_432372 [Suillus luteus UH-Slu-Lm8-n1]|uniref:Uncharacterized protein n=1 Tax=Suillus luteus UH-Slu-Lm8-n1 TaxID=930992 RepID=A0A0D0BU36_9AGAM|nr:hypothetical protein CY34DRAFT_432372 [Suillus luteus UH-Slu-Lm8-n1]